MEMYLLKSAACLAILMIFYKLLLEKENMNVFKRCYLLAAVLISLIIPWITFTTYSEPVAAESLVLLRSDFAPASTSQEKISHLPLLLWSIYGIGVLFFGIKFILNLRIILLRIKRNPKIRSGKTVNVLLRENLAPHTFWHYIFLNRQKFEEKEIPKEVFQHEQAHANQKHSADILFIELLQVIFWFNPLLYMVSRAIRLNHEFLADRAVLKNGIQPALYQKTLLAFSSNVFNSSLVNPINYQSIKKRFTVMKTNTSRKMIWVKSLALLPLLAVLTYSFSTTDIRFKSGSPDFQQKENYIIQPSGDTLVITEDINIRMISKEHLVLNGNTISYDELSGMLESLNSHIPPEQRNKLISAEISTTKEFPVGRVNDVKRALYYYGITLPKVTLTGTPETKGEEDQEKATLEMINEYNRLTRKVNEEKILKEEEANRILYIESILSEEQRISVVGRKLKILQFPSIQEKATPQMVSEYNKWAKHYNKNANTFVEVKVWQRMKHIYSIMTPRQKKDAEKFPSLNPNYIITIEEDEINGTPAVKDKSGVVPPPPPPPAPTVTKDGDIPSPPPPPPAPENSKMQVPPPPPPPSPVEAIEKWIEEDAEFFYNGKKISGKKALEIVKENEGKNLSVQIEENSSGKTIRISDNKETKATGPKTSAKKTTKYTNPMKRSETIEHLRELAAEGVVFTYLGKEISVNETIKHLERKVTLRYSEVDSKRIMRVEDL